MPRKGRVVLPNYPHHIVQRGHNRQIIFAETQDYRYYLDTLKEFKDVYDVKVFAFCLMTNHIHLVLQPSANTRGLAQLMKRLAGRQTRYVNHLEGRRGTLWESRYKSSPIQTDGYLLACCRYVELNPVRANMAQRPEDYAWSSYNHKIGLASIDWLDQDPDYMALGDDQDERQMRYRSYVVSDRAQDDILIREAVSRSQLTGDSRFVDEVELMIGRRVEHRRQGRPKK